MVGCHDKERLELLKKLMEVQFANVETALYLDTHPRDARVIAQHNQYVCQLEMLKKQYEHKYGPLTHQGMSPCPWRYIESPWPWEIEY